MIPRVAGFVAMVFAFTLGSTTPVQAQKVTPAGSLQVVDANERLVGPVVYMTESLRVVVILKIDPHLVPLAVSKSHFLSSSEFSGQEVYFDSPLCSGNAFISYSDETSVLPFASVGVPNMTVYLAQGAVESFQGQSWSLTSELGYRCEDVEPFDGIGTPARPLVDLSSQFTPPFRVR